MLFWYTCTRVMYCNVCMCDWYVCIPVWHAATVMTLLTLRIMCICTSTIHLSLRLLLLTNCATSQIVTWAVRIMLYSSFKCWVHCGASYSIIANCKLGNRLRLVRLVPWSVQLQLLLVQLQLSAQCNRKQNLKQICTYVELFPVQSLYKKHSCKWPKVLDKYKN